MIVGVLARQAEAWYRTYQPQAYAGIKDKQTFFADLEEQARQQIQQTADQLAGPDPEGESYPEKLGRLNAAQQAATEKVMREFLLSPPPPNAPDNALPRPATPDPSMVPTQDPIDQALSQALADFQEAADELRRQERESAKAAMPTLPARPAHLS